MSSCTMWLSILATPGLAAPPLDFNHKLKATYEPRWKNKGRKAAIPSWLLLCPSIKEIYYIKVSKITNMTNSRTNHIEWQPNSDARRYQPLKLLPKRTLGWLRLRSLRAIPNLLINKAENSPICLRKWLIILISHHWKPWTNLWLSQMALPAHLVILASAPEIKPEIEIQVLQLKSTSPYKTKASPFQNV